MAGNWRSGRATPRLTGYSDYRPLPLRCRSGPGRPVAHFVEHPGETDGVLVVDETGLLKKGAKPVGVQWNGGRG